jgi:hypothetical protein
MLRFNVPREERAPRKRKRPNERWNNAFHSCGGMGH